MDAYMSFITDEIAAKVSNSQIFYWDWELALLHWFNSIHNGVLDIIVPMITKLGNAGIFWILLTILLLLLPKTKKVGGASFFGLFFSVLFTNIILKHVFMRCRPCWLLYAQYKGMSGLHGNFAWLKDVTYLVSFPDDYSFPSGHSSASFAAAVAIFIAIEKDTNKKWLGVLAIVLAACIALSRLYLGVHWPTDVIVGSLVGIISGILGAKLMSAILLHFKRKDLSVGL